jgi:hypothetical protein
MRPAFGFLEISLHITHLWRIVNADFLLAAGPGLVGSQVESTQNVRAQTEFDPCFRSLRMRARYALRGGFS